MPIGIKRITAPDALWTPDELRDIAPLAGDDSDTKVAELLARATRFVETRISRAFLTQTWRQSHDAFPCGRDPIRLLRAPVITIEPAEDLAGVTYQATAGSWTTLSTAVLEANAEPARIVPAYGESWPSTVEVPGAVRIDFECGYGDERDDVPEDLLQCVLGIVTHWHQNPEAVASGQMKEVPCHLEDILGSYEYVWEAT